MLTSDLFVRRVGLLTGCYLVAASIGASSPPSRIGESLESGRTFQLSGNTHPLIRSLPDKGSTNEQTALPRLTIEFQRSAKQQASLTKLLAGQQNPSSPQYHKWITPEEFGEQFGMSSQDLEKVRHWLQNVGFTNIQVARSKNAISMSGTVGKAEYAFETPIHNFDRNGVLHYANTADPMLPAALQGMVSYVRGLSDLRPKPRSMPRPRFTSNISGDIYIAPGDFTTIYDLQPLYNNGINGAGQKIAIAGQTDIQTFDIEAFQTAAGLTVKGPTVVLDGTDPGLQSSDLSEAELDIEWAGAVAPGATIIYVNSSDAFTSAIYAIQNQLANVLSLTYGQCEAQTGQAEIQSLDLDFQQASAQGMTVVAAAGDSGAADCDYSSDPSKLDTVATNGLAVDFPASDPNVTGVGGTQFNEGTGTYWASTNNSDGESALSYIPEIAWNDDCTPGATSASDCTATSTYGLSASGGGVSTAFNTKPAWQVGPGVPADGARDVPDLSLDASPNHDGYLVCETPPTNGVPATTSSCVNGTFRNASTYLNVVGGTSIASPMFAGIVALIDQMTGAAQGNVNPRLYALASLSSDDFHDITAGNNFVPCTVGTPDCGSNGILGYNAAAGYDQVTGLGSIDATNLVESFAPSFTLSINPTTLTVADSSSGTATVAVAAFGGFTGTVSFTCSVPSTLTGITCQIPGSVTGSGSTTLTISNSTSSSSVGPKWRWIVPIETGGWLLPLSALGLLLTSALAAMRRPWRVKMAGAALLSAMVMTGCGGGSSSSGSSSSVTTTPPSVTGTVTVTAVSSATSLASSITKTITLSVTEP